MVWLVFLLSLLAGVVWHMPVTQLFRWVTPPPEIRLNGVEGNLFRGRITRVAFDQYAVDDLVYRFQPGCLLRLAVCYRLTSAPSEADVNLVFHPFSRSLQVVDSRVVLDASIVAQAPGLLVKPSGRFRVELATLEVNAQGRIEQLAGDVVWLDAGVVGEDQILGDYRATVTTAEQALRIELTDAAALLGVDGAANLEFTGAYRLDLELTTQPELDPGLVSMLDTLTRKTGLNRYQVRQQGRLPPMYQRQLQQGFATEG